MESELCAIRSTLQVKDRLMGGRQDIIGVKLFVKSTLDI